MAIPQSVGQTSDLTVFAAPISGVVQVHPGVLRLTGKDAADFLNRMSTNDLSKLKNREFVSTVLTTEKGRMIDVIRVLSLDDALLILTSEGSEGAVRHWLERYVIMEDIGITGETADWFTVNLFGDSIPKVLSLAGVGDPIPAVGNPVLTAQVEFGTLHAVRDELWPCTVVTLLVTGHASKLEALQTAIMREAEVIPGDALAAYMIDEGIPSAGKEISLDYNPLECNFWRFVNFSKGCYIGQEVIARLDSYNKLQKRMTGFHFEPGDMPGPAPGTIFAGDEPAGTTTRHALSSGANRWIALGFLKIGADASNLSFESQQVAGRLKIHAVTLPFTPS